MEKKEITCGKCGYTYQQRKSGSMYCPLCKQLLYSIVDVLEMVNREINKKEKHFLMS